MDQQNKRWRSAIPGSVERSVLDWWCGLAGYAVEKVEGADTYAVRLSDQQANRADRAELCRASGLQEIVLTRGYVNLLGRCVKSSVATAVHDHAGRLAGVAWVLAQIRHYQNWSLSSWEGYQAGSLGKAMVKVKTAKDKPRVSEARFKRLLSCRSHDEFCRELTRVIDLLERTADPIAVASVAYEWDADWVKRQLARDYYLGLFNIGQSTEQAAEMADTDDVTP